MNFKPVEEKLLVLKDFLTSFEVQINLVRQEIDQLKKETEKLDGHKQQSEREEG
jgi:hypothetical protein